MSKPILTCALLLSLAAAAIAQTRTYTVVDVQSIQAEGDPAQWVHHVRPAAPPTEVACDMLVAGAGMGGVAAALRAAELGNTVCLTEETDWIGGQATAGGVSALDENRFMEFSGGTRSYYEFRRLIREHYRKTYRLAPQVEDPERFNPGSCYVSPLCFEPHVAVNVLEQVLAERHNRIRVFKRTQIVDLEVASGTVRSALAFRFDTNDFLRFRPRFVLDATELGDLLPLAGVPYVVGSQSRSETNEPHATESANAACVQSFTYSFAIDFHAGENHRIARPPDYARLRDSQHFSLRLNYSANLGWQGNVQYTMFGEDPPIPNDQTPGPFFPWRRLLARRNFTGPNAPSDLALINWPGQDYGAESILDRSPLDMARVLQQAKRVSLAFLYWLQNEVPRDDGRGNGYPELMLRPEVMGTTDGLSKYPYIRESRRIRGRQTVLEQDVVTEYQKGPRARWFPDSIGIGFHMVDIHPCDIGESARMMMPRPFQIPMGALIPQRVTNLLAAGKDLGVSHITNGAFRLHPVEWNVGEAAAVIASLALAGGALPATGQVQTTLVQAGVPLVWFDDLPPSHPAFAAVQLSAIRGTYPLSQSDLHAAPDAPVTRGEAAHALAAVFGRNAPQSAPACIDVPSEHPSAAAIRIALENGWMGVDHRNWFHPDLPFYWTDWREDHFPWPLPAIQTKRFGPITRAELARRLASVDPAAGAHALP